MWIGGFTFHVLIAVICGIMMWELLRMIGAEGRAPAIATPPAGKIDSYVSGGAFFACDI